MEIKLLIGHLGATINKLFHVIIFDLEQLIHLIFVLLFLVNFNKFV